MFNAPQEPDTKDAEKDAAPESAQDQGNWEARFKGLQREYQGTKGYATKLQNEINDLKLKWDNETTDSQGKIVQLSTELDAARKRAELAEKELVQFRQVNQQLTRDQQVRKVLAQDFNDLTKWYDTGYL